MKAVGLLIHAQNLGPCVFHTWLVFIKKSSQLMKHFKVIFHSKIEITQSLPLINSYDYARNILPLSKRLHS